MTHDELLDEITAYERRTCNSAQDDSTCVSLHPLAIALRAVVNLHKPYDSILGETCCVICDEDWDIPAPYPCPTIQAIEKELL